MQTETQTKINIRKELEQNKIVMLVVPSRDYPSTLTEIIKQLKDKMEKCLYVTLNNPYASLVASLKKKGLNPNKIFFLDAISATTKLKQEAKNCVFVSKPNALTELSIAIKETLNKLKPKIIIFDSLSSLVIYLPINSIVNFTKDLATKLKETDSEAIFPIIKNEELIKNMGMFINKVVEIG